MGTPITMGPQGLEVADDPSVPFIEGDGTGPDIWAAAVRVFDAAVDKAYDGRRKVDWVEVLAGEKALNETGRAALGQFASRGQQYLVLLRPKNGVIVMEQLHYSDEMKSPAEVPIPEGDVKETELKLAKQLIDQGTTETFEPAKYKDTVRERVLEAIQGKVEGQEITTEPATCFHGIVAEVMPSWGVTSSRS